MSGTYKDIRGQKFGRLTVIDTTDQRTPNGNMVWQCLCDCGKFFLVDSSRLRTGNTKSCGCLHPDRITKHNKSYSRLYRIWSGMKYRCNNPNAAKYRIYGARGITVCKEWTDNFQSFYDWAMSNGYADNLTIDRINNSGNYEPANCRWVDSVVQNNNRRICRRKDNT